jgi:hypothetical protein
LVFVWLRGWVLSWLRRFLFWKRKAVLKQNKLPVVSTTLEFLCARGNIFVMCRLFLGLFENKIDHFFSIKILEIIL